MQRSSVDIQTRDGAADAYLVRPQGNGPYPAVLLFMDAFGIRPRLEEMADRIAERGYAVLVPNLLYRFGRSPIVDMDELKDPDRRGAVFGKVMPMIKDLDRDKLTSDAASYLDFMASAPGVDGGPAVLVGYCMGGRNALVAAEEQPSRVRAVASFHAGGVVTDEPDSPHRHIGSLGGVELYFAHADNDGSMTADNIATLERALTDAGVTYASELYQGAPHGFTMTDTAMYHEEGEKRHWTRLFELLDRVHPAG
ncbi:dienelactone hydrolase family protein [Actinoplanes sp. NPDC049265]|uniref:dienelactone hydrolase family protein n=1 Tax=Actinoplanes sp. NPDC049265 TaxID=3363902 RepID=UPI003713299C